MTTSIGQISRRMPRGLWLPLITPFKDGALDTGSLARLAAHYAELPIDGLVLAATTGEGMTLDKEEVEQLVTVVYGTVGDAKPLYLGLSGSDTRKLASAVGRVGGQPVQGFLIACPYYTRPGQDGLYRHFEAIDKAADRPVLIYNIPYRTGVNLKNDTMLGLAELPNIVGVKDCCADLSQSFDLLRRRPLGFSVLTGEDPQYYVALAQGADGGILASAHVETADFIDVLHRLRRGDLGGALNLWRRISYIPELLFAEPSPAPIKYWLWRIGLIDSPEVRLPMTEVSASLASRIDAEVARRQAA